MSKTKCDDDCLNCVLPDCKKSGRDCMKPREDGDRPTKYIRMTDGIKGGFTMPFCHANAGERKIRHVKI